MTLSVSQRSVVELHVDLLDKNFTHPPPLLVVVPIVHPPPGPHDVCHLLKEDAVVSLHRCLTLFLHLQLLQFEVQMHVGLRRLVVNHRLCIFHLEKNNFFKPWSTFSA